ncbi:MAG: class I SAM-dependent methyltransferase [candidate division Zixibacteria bacterium]|nr:class I SAM-dependent methyltransferase [candidate division Zixibacteria bacterium]
MAKSRMIDKNYIKEVASAEEFAPNEVKSIISILGLKPKAKVLDLCCGYGRHAIPLAQMGYQVTGFEISEPLYKKAKDFATSAGVKLNLVHGDMRNIHKELNKKFDTIINIFTAFGFYTKDSDNQKVLNNAAKLLKKNGNFLIDLANRENVLRRWQPRQWYSTGPTMVLEEAMFDFFSSRLEVTRTLITADNQKEVSDYSLRLYSLHEMLSMINKAGLSASAVFGDFKMNQYSVDSRRMIILAQKLS